MTAALVFTAAVVGYGPFLAWATVGRPTRGRHHRRRRWRAHGRHRDRC